MYTLYSTNILLMHVSAMQDSPSLHSLRPIFGALQQQSIPLQHVIVFLVNSAIVGVHPPEETGIRKNDKYNETVYNIGGSYFVHQGLKYFKR